MHGDQVDAYLNDIRGRLPGENLERVVVLLSPRNWEPSCSVPEQALRADWQAFARGLPTLAAGLEAPAQRWLLNQYVRYLEEEGLSDPGALTVSTALALMHYEQADDAAAGFCEHADAYVAEYLGDRTDWAKDRSAAPTFGLGYWANYTPYRRGEKLQPRWEPAWFEWGLRYMPYLQNLEEPRGSYAFIAGASTRYAKEEHAYGRATSSGWPADRPPASTAPGWTTTSSCA